MHEKELLNRIDFLRTEVQAWMNSAKELNALYQKERLRANRIEEERRVLARANVNLAKHIGKLEGESCR